MSAADFRKLAELFPDEAVTHSSVQDIQLPAADGGASPGVLALITLYGEFRSISGFIERTPGFRQLDLLGRLHV